MKHGNKSFFVLLVIAALLIPACSTGNVENAEITISVSLDASVSIDNMRLVIRLTGPTGEKTYSVKGGGPHKVNVVSGP